MNILMHSWLSNWGLLGSARDQILNYLQDLAKKKYISQTFFHLVSITTILMVIIGDTLTTGVSQAFRWKFAGAKHLRRMEAAPRKKSRGREDLQGKKWRCLLSKAPENTVVCQMCGISRKL